MEPAKLIRNNSNSEKIQEDFSYFERSLDGLYVGLNRTRSEEIKQKFQQNLTTAERIKGYIKKNKNGNYYIDEANTYFFKMGGVMYSEIPYFMANYEKGQCQWAAIDTPNTMTSRAVKLADYVMDILNSKDKVYLDRVGVFMTVGPKWGFTLFLDSLEELYDGGISETWKILLQTRFIHELLGRFAYFMKDDGDKKQEFKVDILPTLDDDPIHPGLVTFFDRLFVHQTQEIGWMFGLEMQPYIKVIQQVSTVPFFDTGYYIDINKPSLLLNEKQLPSDSVFLPGGLLASRVGSGKTISIIGLISISKQIQKLKAEAKARPNQEVQQKNSNMQEEHKLGEFEKLQNGVGDNYDPIQENIEALSPYLHVHNIDGPSLVIVTKNILHQWYEEFKQFAPNLDVFLVSDVAEFDNIKHDKSTIKHDVILTHREAFAAYSSLKKGEKAIWFNYTEWRRIIIDEFHELTTELNKDSKQNNASKNWIRGFVDNLLKLKTNFTWGITGTPEYLNFHAGIDSLFKLLRYDEKYLKLSSIDAIKIAFFKNCIRQNVSTVDLPPLTKSTIAVDFGQMQQLLYKGKLQSIHGEQAAYELCSCLLPEWRLLNDFEKDQYKAAISKVQEKHAKDIQEIKMMLQSNPKDKILQIRYENLTNEGNFYLEMISLLSQELFSCPICFDEIDKTKIVVTDCLHVICEICWKALFKQLIQVNCPMCKQLIGDKTAIIHPRYGKNNESKLERLLQEIFQVPEGEKIILFTQFTVLVDRLSEIFNELGIEYIVLKGVASEINLRLNKFKKIPDIKVLVMSVEQSASGINVTEANHVFFAHPIFGSDPDKAKTTYTQCIGRAYRIGQGRAVNAKIFITSNSLEEDLVPPFLKA